MASLGLWSSLIGKNTGFQIALSDTINLMIVVILLLVEGVQVVICGNRHEKLVYPAVLLSGWCVKWSLIHRHHCLSIH